MPHGQPLEHLHRIEEPVPDALARPAGGALEAGLHSPVGGGGAGGRLHAVDDAEDLLPGAVEHAGGAGHEPSHGVGDEDHPGAEALQGAPRFVREFFRVMVDGGVDILLQFPAGIQVGGGPVVTEGVDRELEAVPHRLLPAVIVERPQDRPVASPHDPAPTPLVGAGVAPQEAFVELRVVGVDLQIAGIELLSHEEGLFFCGINGCQPEFLCHEP